MKEMHHRSLVKAITWRMIGTMDTIMLSWIITGHFNSALKIGGIELITKTILYFLHERAWIRIPYGREKIFQKDGTFILKDFHHRSIVKGISWRIFGTIDTAIIALFITGNYLKAFSIGFAEVFTKIFLFYLHERIWHLISFGRKASLVKD